MLGRLNAVNAKERYYQARLGVTDTQFVIDAAALLLELDIDD